MKNMKIILRALLLLSFILPAAASIRAQNNVCRLTYAYLDKATRALAGTNGLGEFTFDAKDEQVEKSFIHEESGTRITVAAQIYGDPDELDRKAKRFLKLALVFGEPPNKNGDPFGYGTDSAVAESVYDKTDNWVSVSKTLDAGKRIYRFRFGCFGK
jgi:hypothetical protein